MSYQKLQKIKYINDGTYGRVYLAKSPNSGKKYALKRNFAPTKISFSNSLHELDLLVKNNGHPYVVHLDSICLGDPFPQNDNSPPIGTLREGQKDDNIHFVLEIADCSLSDYICSMQYTFKLMKKHMFQMAVGLEYIHAKGCIHRDIKPCNILVFKEQECVKYCDFGMAKPYTYQEYQTPDVVTTWYRPPEMCMGIDTYTKTLDVWSLGCVFFEMVSGGEHFICIKEEHDNNNVNILNKIISRLPKYVPTSQIKKTMESKHMVVTSTKKKPGFREILKLTDEEIYIKFEEEMGPFDVFIDMLEKMLTFDYRQRITSYDLVKHPFFDEFSDDLKKIYETHEPMRLSLHKINVVDCKERTWGLAIAFTAFDNRQRILWYKHRIIFQAISLYDRYLHHAYTENYKTETEIRGKFMTKDEAQLKFFVCLYLSLKYFSSIHSPNVFLDIIVDIMTENHKFKDDKYTKMAETFEKDLLRDCLGYNIYEPTLFEIPDMFQEKIGIGDVKKLLSLMRNVEFINNKSPDAIYEEYKRGPR